MYIEAASYKKTEREIFWVRPRGSSWTLAKGVKMLMYTRRIHFFELWRANFRGGHIMMLSLSARDTRPRLRR